MEVDSSAATASFSYSDIPPFTSTRTIKQLLSENTWEKYVDKRIQSTRTQLQASLRSMLSTTSWNKISINALCKSADVSRSTFYSHFDNKEALLDSLLSEFEQAMRADNNNRSLSTTRLMCFLPILTGHVSSNRHVFAQMNRSAENMPVAQRFYEMVIRLTTHEYEAAFGNTSDPNLLAFISGGIYNTIVQWSASSTDATHLKLLDSIDQLVEKQLPENNKKRA